MSTTSRYRQRVICQPQRWPAAAARQLCVENAVPAAAIASAASMICSAGTPVSVSANSGVNCAYSSFSAASKLSNVRGRSGLLRLEIVLPVHPVAHELAVVQVFFDQES